MTAPLTVLQITDTHLQAPSPAQHNRPTLLGMDTTDSLAAVLGQALAEHAPDALVASGDLAHEPEPATYQRFRALVEQSFAGPVLYLAGNHDLAAPFEQVLGATDTVPLHDWEIIAFDSHVDHRTEAGFSDAEHRDLVRRIDRAAADHLLLVCHHHLLPVGCPWLDKDRIPGGAELLDELAAHPRVRGLVFGHVHQEVAVRVSGMPVLGTPSTCFQFEPGSERFTIDRSAGTGRPGYRWLMLGDDGSVGTRVGRLTDYPVRIDFSDRS